MLHPNQFEVDEAWIAFRLNDAPIQTERDGSFNCVCLMDAASCFILGNVFVPANESEPSQLEARRLLKIGWDQHKRFPATVFIPTGQFRTNLPAEAERRGITVAPVHESQLLVFIGDARQSFTEHFQGGAAQVKPNQSLERTPEISAAFRSCPGGSGQGERCLGATKDLEPYHIQRARLQILLLFPRRVPDARPCALPSGRGKVLARTGNRSSAKSSLGRGTIERDSSNRRGPQR